jgi:cysteine desulfurase
MPPINKGKRFYFDWAATPIPDLQPEDIPFAHPSSAHADGKKARAALENARSRCAAVLGVKPETIFFTSGGTESNAIVLYSLLARQGGGSAGMSAVEHPSIKENLKTLERLGKKIFTCGVNSCGCVDSEAFTKTLEKSGGLRLAAIMGVNNETGAINDLAALGKILRDYEKTGKPPVHFHSDLVQACGKIPLDIKSWDLDSASISAHKIGGPRGAGLLYLRKPLEVLYTGGGQEGGIRPGTENTAGAIALARCLENHAATEVVSRESEKALGRMQRLTAGLLSSGRCTLIPEEREKTAAGAFTPFILQAAFDGIPGEVMARALDDEGFSVSTGSACHTGSAGRPVLAAMGVSEKLQREGIRISQGWSTSDEDIDALVEAIGKLLKYL